MLISLVRFCASLPATAKVCVQHTLFQFTERVLHENCEAKVSIIWAGTTLSRRISVDY